MPAEPSELAFLTDGEPYARLCVEATFYWRESMYDQAPKLADAYRRALDTVREGIVYFESGTMSGAKKLKADTLEMVPFWLLKAKRREDIHIMQLKGGSKPDEPSDSGLQFFADEEEEPAMGALSVVLPIAYADEPGALLRLANDLASCADFESGHCGYSIAWDPQGDSAVDAMQRMPGIAGRFLGVDLPKLNTTVSALRRSSSPAIKTVQWLTFLGPAVLAQLGGVTRAKAGLRGAGTVGDVGGGLLVQAGAAPTLGDANRQTDLSALRAVGKALGSVRVKNHGPIFGTRDHTAAWLARFD